MRMACSGGHVLVLIHDNTKEDHERCIAFLWNPNGLFVRTKNKSCKDDSGQQPPTESKPNVFLEPPKEKLSWDENGRWFSNDRSKHLLERLLLICSRSSSKSFFEVVTS